MPGALIIRHILAPGAVLLLALGFAFGGSWPLWIGGAALLAFVAIRSHSLAQGPSALDYPLAALENSPIPTFVIDQNHQVILWDKACELAFGVSASAIIGTRQAWKPFYDHERPGLADLVMTQDTAALETLYPHDTDWGKV